MSHFREELSNMHGVCDAWVSQVALLDATVRELQVEISQLHAGVCVCEREREVWESIN